MLAIRNTAETIRVKTNQLDYRLRSVQKSRPQKKLPETDAIFHQLDQFRAEALADPSLLRLSLDAKATVLIGPFSRRGQTRVVVRAMDHDFRPDQTLTPWGIFLPEQNELYLYFTASGVTADFIMDCLCDFWQTVHDRFPRVTTLLLNQDNGPENHSRRTQFMKRVTEFVDQFQITVQLAYYPPYHSKYNSRWHFRDDYFPGNALKAGAADYLTKDSVPGELVAALGKVARGERYVSQSLAEALTAQLGGPAGQAPREALSDHGDQVMRLLAAGKSEIMAETCPAPECNLLPTDVVQCVDELEDYDAQFVPAFRRPEQADWTGVYLRGLLGDVPRKTAERMALDQGKNPRTLQHFLGQSPWERDAVLQIHQRLIVETLGEDDAVALIDESGNVKQGAESVGAAPQYCGAVGKVANSQNGVYLGYASRKGYALMEGRLYRPDEWFDDAHADRRKHCGVPEDLAFKTEPAIALELLQAALQRGDLPCRSRSLLKELLVV